MNAYRIAWLPGDGIGKEVMDAARIVLDGLDLHAEYLAGDIGWDYWCHEGDALPPRTVELLGRVDAALFGAVTPSRRRRPRTSSLPRCAGGASSTARPSCGCARSSTCTCACGRAGRTRATR
jgi:3-isopropylmalate dehydrogenase